jgi:non-specific serine/threonine protein kinase
VKNRRNEKAEEIDVPEMLRLKRVKEGLTQEALSQRLRISRPLISKAEQGHLTESVNRQLSDYFHIDLKILEDYRRQKKAARRNSRRQGPAEGLATTGERDASTLPQMALAQSWDEVSGAAMALSQALATFLAVPSPALGFDGSTLRQSLSALLTVETASAQRRTIAVAAIELIVTLWLHRRSDQFTTEEWEMLQDIQDRLVGAQADPVPEEKYDLPKLPAVSSEIPQAADPSDPDRRRTERIFKLRWEYESKYETAFFGQDETVGTVVGLLESSSVRMVTLTGPGGAGKTRVADTVAPKVLAAFNSNVISVNLSVVSDATDIFTAIAHGLSVKINPSEKLLVQIAKALPSVPYLLVLDNFEHLIRSKGVDKINELLDCLPTVKCLITSRERLNVPGEHEVVVPPLSLPTGGERLQELKGFSSIQLFVDRARETNRDFVLNEENCELVASLCLKLGGLPKAIEIAAPRMATLIPADLAEALKNIVDYDLNALIQTSYDSLTELQQRCFVMLSVFQGWDEEAVSAVCGPDAVTSLEALVGLGLVEAGQIPPPENSNQTKPWYRMHETVRTFAAQALADRSLDAFARQKHRTYFLSLAEKARPLLNGSEQETWFHRLKTENDNLITALNNCPDDERLRLAASLWFYFMMAGMLTEGRRYLAEALARASETPSVTRALALDGAAALAWQQGDFSEGIRLASDGLDVARQVGDVEREGYCHIRFGLIHRSMSQADNEDASMSRVHRAESRKYFQSALSIFRVTANQIMMGSCYTNLGILDAEDNQPKLALENFKRALEYTSARLEKGNILGNIAALNIDLEQFDEAKTSLLQAIENFIKVDARRQIATSFQNLSMLAYIARDLSRAARLRGAADALLGQIGVSATEDDKLDVQTKELTLETATVYANEREAGRALSMHEAVSYALSDAGMDADLLGGARREEVPPIMASEEVPVSVGPLS